MSFFHIHVLVVVKYVKYYIDLQVRDYIGVLCLNRHANLGVIYMVSYTNIKGQSKMCLIYYLELPWLNCLDIITWTGASSILQKSLIAWLMVGLTLLSYIKSAGMT